MSRPSAIVRQLRLGLSCLTLPLLACGSAVDFTPVDASAAARPAVHPEQVLMYRDGPPSAPHRVIGRIEGQQKSQYSTDDLDAVLQAMRAEAARRGCEGLVITGPNDSLRGNETDGHVALTRLEGLRGSCVVMTD